MGDSKRMGNGCTNVGQTIQLYSSQAEPVLEAIRRDGACYSKAEYVRRKYQESAPIFLAAYQWYVKQAEKIVPKPEGAEFPYWVFRDLYNVDRSAGGRCLTLDVPTDEVVFFDTQDWNKILRLTYIGESEEDEKAFSAELERRGMDVTQVMLTAFYPEWKRKIMDSWTRLFRHHDAIRSGDLSGVHSVQAGLWRICEDWIRK